jgi:putative protease
MAIIKYCKKIKQPVHISTQCNITNIEEVKFYSKYAKAIVLARELNLKQITKINKQIKEQNLKVKTEAFVHGALCVAISGKCYMSLATYNTSANRGKCLQPCRRQYQVTDIETQKQLNIKNKFVMSPSDLCTIRILPKLIKAGIQIFKIEGRARSPEYVYTVTKVYKQAIQTKNPTKQQVEQWEKELGKVYNRGFWHNGYYMGEKVNEWSQSYGSKAKEKKILLGKVINYYKKAKIAHIKIESNQLKVNDTILITGPTTGIIKTKVKQMHHNKQSIKQAKKPSDITIKTNLVRKNDKVYKLIKR